MSDAPEHPNHDLELTGPMDGPQAELHPVDAAVGMEARIMLKSVRIPADGAIPADLADEIRKTALAHIQANKITFREVSAQIGVGESTISEVLRGKYQRADDSPILRKLNGWIDDDERRRRKVRPVGFYPTCVFEAIRSLAQYAKSNARIPGSRNTHGGIAAQDLPRIVIGWGPAGCGKSLGAAALHAEDTLSILVRVDQRRGSDFGLAELIMEAAGWRGRARNRSLINFIMEKLRDSGRLLIIDEGHRLKRSACELIRDLCDVCGVPVMILATHEFYEHLTRVRTKSGDLFYDQFSRRVGLVVNLIKGVDGKGGVKRPIYSVEEVRQIFSADGVRLSPGAIDYLTAVSCTPGLGMLGLAAVIFELALRSALRKNRVIDEPLLRKCAERVLIPAGELDAAILRQIDQVQQTNRQIAARAAG